MQNCQASGLPVKELAGGQANYLIRFVLSGAALQEIVHADQRLHFAVTPLEFSDQRHQLLIGLPCAFRCLFGSRDVAHNGNHHAAALRSHRTQHNVYREFALIFALTEQFQTDSHRSHARIGDVAGDVFDVPFSKSLGH